MSEWQKQKDEQWREQTVLLHRSLLRSCAIPLGVLAVCTLILVVSHTLLTLPTAAAVVSLYVLIRRLAPALRRTDSERQSDLRRILTSEQEAARFDAELAAQPVQEIELLDGDGRLYFTEHYLVRQTGGIRPRYRLFSLEEICSSRVFTNPRTTIVGSSTKVHMIEFYSAERKTIGYIELRGRAACVELEAAYRQLLPHAHWNLGKHILK